MVLKNAMAIISILSRKPLFSFGDLSIVSSTRSLDNCASDDESIPL